MRYRQCAVAGAESDSFGDERNVYPSLMFFRCCCNVVCVFPSYLKMLSVFGALNVGAFLPFFFRERTTTLCPNHTCIVEVNLANRAEYQLLLQRRVSALGTMADDGYIIRLKVLVGTTEFYFDRTLVHWTKIGIERMALQSL